MEVGHLVPVGRHDAARYAALNLGLHRRIVEMSGNAKLIEIHSRLIKELTLFRRHSVAPDVTLHQHRLIVDRIAARDSDGAAAALLAHVESSRHRIMMAYSP